MKCLHNSEEAYKILAVSLKNYNKYFWKKDKCHSLDVAAIK